MTLDVGYLLLAAAPNLRRGVPPLSHPCAFAAWHTQPLPLPWDVGNTSWTLPLRRGVLPASARDLGRWVDPLGRALCTSAAACTLCAVKATRALCHAHGAT